MAKIHIVNLLEISHWIVPDDSDYDEGTNQIQYRFQNGNVDKPITFRGNDYTFVPFVYSGATKTRTGDNIEAALTLPSNQIAMDYAYDIVMLDYTDNQHHIKRQVKVYTCMANNDFTEVAGEQKVLSTENWIGSSMAYTEETVEIQLSSVIDAVFAGLPNVYIDEATFGKLPTTSRINTA